MEIVDAHTHLELFLLKNIPIEKATTKREIIELIENTGETKPVVAWGWSEEKIGEAITKKDIDRFPFPVLLIRVDAHMGVVNEKAIEEIRIKPSAKFEPEKGYLYEEELWNAASFFKLNFKSKNTEKALLRAQEEAISKGIVEVHDFVDLKTAEAYFKLRENGKLKLKAVLMPYYRDYKKVLELFEIHGEDKLIKLGWVKTFVDGSIGARTAYLKEPYLDKPSKGLLLKQEEELISMIRELEKKGLKISLHAIGDKAIEVALSAFEKANIRLKGHRIEHAEMIDYLQAQKVKELGLILCIQPNFNPVFMQTYLKALGKERVIKLNPIKMLDEMGVDMIFGSDMMPFDPEVGIEYASKILGREKAIYYYGGWKKKTNP